MCSSPSTAFERGGQREKVRDQDNTQKEAGARGRGGATILWLIEKPMMVRIAAIEVRLNSEPVKAKDDAAAGPKTLQNPTRPTDRRQQSLAAFPVLATVMAHPSLRYHSLR
jgi:hypothetical protein